MASIDIKVLKNAVNAVLDHIVEDLGMERVEIDQDFYWDFQPPELYDFSKKPSEPAVGSLSDDLDFSCLIERGQSGDVAYNLVHVAPLLRYIAEKVKK